MTARFHKGTALTLLGLSIQAERSLHRALSCPTQWPQFLSFYDERKRAHIVRTLALLRRSGASAGIAPARQEFERSDLFSFLSTCCNLAVNLFKHTWSFSGREVAFFFTALEHLLEIVRCGQRPRNEESYELRLDFCQCCGIIQHRLLGVSETAKVEKIEHFNQSEYRKYFTFQELGLEAGETAPVPARAAR